MTPPRRQPNEVQNLITAIAVCATALCMLGFAVAEWRSYATLADYVSGRDVPLRDLLGADNTAGVLGTFAAIGTIATVVLMATWTWRARVRAVLMRAARREWVLLLGAGLVVAITRNSSMNGALAPVLKAVVGETIGGVLLTIAAVVFVLALRRQLTSPASESTHPVAGATNSGPCR